MTASRPSPDARVRDVLAAAGAGATLLAVDGDAAAAEAVAIADVTHDSRQVRPGVLFACRPGRTADGHDHAPTAVAAGAPALLVERRLDVGVPQVQVASVADALGPVAAAVHGHPAEQMLLIGVTGTNGKTTTAYLLDAVLSAAGHTTGLVGTIETRIAGERIPGVRTTPEAPDLQRLLRRMVEAGATAAAMEVSSHGLALGRVRATRFAAVLFTNLSQDHLDFHRDMEDYFAAKATLFTPSYGETGIVNIDDGYGARLAADATIRTLTVSVAGAAADVVASDVTSDAAGSSFTATVTGRDVPVRVQLPGAFNVGNALLAIAAAHAVGVPLDQAAAGLAACRGVPGRMERVDVGQPFSVFVDYAHTPDSVANVLHTVRALTDARVLIVLGCGGDRDAGKRRLMGRVAAELADQAIFTSDNPRSEDPQAILDAVTAGAAEVTGSRWTAELDRRAAIAHALAAAHEGDVVVIAGKGHETTQELADRTIAFDDRQVARELLERAA